MMIRYSGLLFGPSTHQW